jgi:hypothetical protein
LGFGTTIVDSSVSGCFRSGYGGDRSAAKYWAPRLIHILLRIATVEQHFQLLFVCNKAIFRGALLAFSVMVGLEQLKLNSALKNHQHRLRLLLAQ